MANEWADLFMRGVGVLSFVSLLVIGLYCEAKREIAKSKERIRRLDCNKSTGGVWYE